MRGYGVINMPADTVGRAMVYENASLFSQLRGSHEAWLVRLMLGRTLSIMHHVASDGLKRDRMSGGRVSDAQTRRAAREALLYLSIAARGGLGLMSGILMVVVAFAGAWQTRAGDAALGSALVVVVGGFHCLVRIVLLRLIPDRHGRLLEPWNLDLAWQTALIAMLMMLIHT